MPPKYQNKFQLEIKMMLNIQEVYLSCFTYELRVRVNKLLYLDQKCLLTPKDIIYVPTC